MPRSPSQNPQRRHCPAMRMLSHYCLSLSQEAEVCSAGSKLWTHQQLAPGVLAKMLESSNTHLISSARDAIKLPPFAK